MVRTYAKNGQVKVLSVISANEEMHKHLLNTGWKHTSTICAFKWIEAVCNAKEDIYHMIDEIHLGPAAI